MIQLKKQQIINCLYYRFYSQIYFHKYINFKYDLHNINNLIKLMLKSFNDYIETSQNLLNAEQIKKKKNNNNNNLPNKIQFNMKKIIG